MKELDKFGKWKGFHMARTRFLYQLESCSPRSLVMKPELNECRAQKKTHICSSTGLILTANSGVSKHLSAGYLIDRLASSVPTCNLPFLLFKSISMTSVQNYGLFKYMDRSKSAQISTKKVQEMSPYESSKKRSGSFCLRFQPLVFICNYLDHKIKHTAQANKLIRKLTRMGCTGLSEPFIMDLDL